LREGGHSRFWGKSTSVLIPANSIVKTRCSCDGIKVSSCNKCRVPKIHLEPFLSSIDRTRQHWSRHIALSNYLEGAVTGIHIGADWSNGCHSRHQTGLIPTIDGDHSCCRGSPASLLVVTDTLLVVRYSQGGGIEITNHESMCLAFQTWQAAASIKHRR